MTMERKIGEIFELGSDWYQCLESPTCNCKHCDFYDNKHDLCHISPQKCLYRERSDKKDVIFKKLEKVGEPYPLYGHIVQRYAGVKFPVALPKEPFAYHNAINNTVDIEIKQENTEDMETNEKTMPVPEGWEFDRIDESGNIVLKEKKKELPKTWEECMKVVDKTEYITNDCEIYDGSIEKLIKTFGGIADADRNLLPLGLGKPMLALCQLLVCRNAWWKQLGWKPDWDDKTAIKHCIHLGDNNHTGITQHSSFSRILAFPTEDTAIRFRNTFRDLIEEAKELL